MPLTIHFFDAPTHASLWPQVVAEANGRLPPHIRNNCSTIDDLENESLVFGDHLLSQAANISRDSCGVCNEKFVAGATRIVSCPDCHCCFHARCAATIFVQNSTEKCGLMPRNGVCHACGKELAWAEFVRSQRLYGSDARGVSPEQSGDDEDESDSCSSSQGSRDDDGDVSMTSQKTVTDIVEIQQPPRLNAAEDGAEEPAIGSSLRERLLAKRKFQDLPF